MKELALAAYAAEHGAHLVAEPRDRAYAVHKRRFDEKGYLSALALAGVRWLARSDPDFPPLLSAIPWLGESRAVARRVLCSSLRWQCSLMWTPLETM